MIRTPHRRSGAAAIATVIALTVTAGCSKDSTSTTTSPTDATTTTVAPVIDPGDGGNYAPKLDPADFVDGIDNPRT